MSCIRSLLLSGGMSMRLGITIERIAAGSVLQSLAAEGITSNISLRSIYMHRV